MKRFLVLLLVSALLSPEISAWHFRGPTLRQSDRHFDAMAVEAIVPLSFVSRRMLGFARKSFLYLNIASSFIRPAAPGGPDLVKYWYLNHGQEIATTIREAGAHIYQNESPEALKRLEKLKEEVLSKTSFLQSTSDKVFVDEVDALIGRLKAAGPSQHLELQSIHNDLYKLIDRGLVDPVSVVSVKDRPSIGPVAAQMMYDAIAQAVRERGRADIIIPADRTSEGTYKVFLELLRRQPLDLSNVHFYPLDDYYGIHPRYRSSSLRAHDKRVIIEPLKQLMSIRDMGFKETNFHYVNYDSEEGIEAEVIRCNTILDSVEVFDFALLGIGDNSHFGFNERWSSFLSRLRKVYVDLITRNQNKQFFGGSAENVPKEAITMGVANVLRAKQIVQLVAGEAKQNALMMTLQEELSELYPSSSLRTHGKVTIIADEEAQGKLHPERFPHRYRVVQPPRKILPLETSVAIETDFVKALPKVKGIIFDYAGTLGRGDEIDEEIITWLFCMHMQPKIRGSQVPSSPLAVNKRQHEWRRQLVQTQKGRPIIETFREMATVINREIAPRLVDGDQLLAEYEKGWTTYYDDAIRRDHSLLLLDGVEGHLRQLRKEFPDEPIFVLTGASQKSIDHQMGLVDMKNGMFTRLVSVEGLPGGKPEGIKKIMDPYEGGEGEWLIVGDAKSDIEAGEGQYCVGIARTPETEENLRSAGARLVVKSVADLRFHRTSMFNVLGVSDSESERKMAAKTRPKTEKGILEQIRDLHEAGLLPPWFVLSPSDQISDIVERLRADSVISDRQEILDLLQARWMVLNRESPYRVWKGRALANWGKIYSALWMEEQSNPSQITVVTGENDNEVRETLPQTEAILLSPTTFERLLAMLKIPYLKTLVTARGRLNDAPIVWMANRNHEDSVLAQMETQIRNEVPLDYALVDERARRGMSSWLSETEVIVRSFRDMQGNPNDLRAARMTAQLARLHGIGWAIHEGRVGLLPWAHARFVEETGPLLLKGGFSGFRFVGNNRSVFEVARAVAYDFACIMLKLIPSYKRLSIATASDPRPSAVTLEWAIQDGLQAAAVALGIPFEIVPLRVLTTPIIQAAVRKLRFLAAIMKTASHNPLKQNGLKLIDIMGAVIRPAIASRLVKTVERLRAEPQAYEDFRNRVASEASPLIGTDHSARAWAIKDYLAEFEARFPKAMRLREKLRGQRAYMHVNGGAGATLDPNGNPGLVPYLARELGMGIAWDTSTPEGTVAHDIEPQQNGKVLEDIIKRMESLDMWNGVWLDYDADRGMAIVNGVPMSPQESALLHVAIALAIQEAYGQADDQEVVIVASEASAKNLENVVSRFNVMRQRMHKPLIRVRRVETGEINVVQAMEEERKHAFVPIGIEGPNGGVIYGDATCRDGLLTPVFLALLNADPAIQDVLTHVLDMTGTNGKARAESLVGKIRGARMTQIDSIKGIEPGLIPGLQKTMSLRAIDELHLLDGKKWAAMGLTRYMESLEYPIIPVVLDRWLRQWPSVCRYVERALIAWHWWRHGEKAGGWVLRLVQADGVEDALWLRSSQTEPLLRHQLDLSSNAMISEMANLFHRLFELPASATVEQAPVATKAAA